MHPPPSTGERKIARGGARVEPCGVELDTVAAQREAVELDTVPPECWLSLRTKDEREDENDCPIPLELVVVLLLDRASSKAESRAWTATDSLPLLSVVAAPTGQREGLGNFSHVVEPPPPMYGGLTVQHSCAALE